MIHNSIGSSIWKNLFIDFDNGNSKDILQDGNISCAYFVSSILKQFGYCGATYANVISLKKHLLEYGRTELQQHYTVDIKPGSIIIREEKIGSEKEDIYGKEIKAHYHIGFYIGNELAISNMSDGFSADNVSARTPQKHHFTYHDSRPIATILEWNFTMNTLEHIAQGTHRSHLNTQLEIPFIGQTKSYLTQYGFDGDDLIRAIGEEDGLSLGRMCGGACIVMAYQYITGSKDKTLVDIMTYKDITHEKGAYRSKESGWYHDGLIAIANKWGLSGVRGALNTEDISALRQLIANCIDNKNILILSVSPGFDTNKKGGHLVVVRGYNRNGYEEEVIINDPLDPKAKEGFSGAPIAKRLSDILHCWSGKYIIISR